MKSDKWLPVVHLKTGNIYFVISKIINCTNKANDCIMVLYVNTAGQMFCREEAEFWQKFKVLDDSQVKIVVNTGNKTGQF